MLSAMVGIQTFAVTNLRNANIKYVVFFVEFIVFAFGAQMPQQNTNNARNWSREGIRGKLDSELTPIIKVA